jgi:hypothetical protein
MNTLVSAYHTTAATVTANNATYHGYQLVCLPTGGGYRDASWTWPLYLDLELCIAEGANRRRHRFQS